MKRGPSRRWRLPVGASLLLHGCGAAVIWWACACWNPSDLTAPLELDTRVALEEDRGIEVAWLDVDVNVHPPTSRRPSPQLPSVTPPPAVETLPGEPRPPVWVPRGTTQETAGNGNTATDQGTGNTGGAATAFFQVRAEGRSIVYVIDRSSSMGANGRLDVARHELLASLARLTPQSRFQIIAYNRYADALRTAGRVELLPATDENKQRAARFLATLVAEGSTDHLPALDQAVVLHPDVIYFLTDADDLKAEQVRALTQLNRGRSAIHAIELSTANRDRDDMPMHVLARTNGGHYRAVEVSR